MEQVQQQFSILKHKTIFIFSLYFFLYQNSMQTLIKHTDLGIKHIFLSSNPRKAWGPEGPPSSDRALANFTPIHHWEGGQLKFEPDM